jgi:hypothetical protein
LGDLLEALFDVEVLSELFLSIELSLASDELETVGAQGFVSFFGFPFECLLFTFRDVD